MPSELSRLLESEVRHSTPLKKKKNGDKNLQKEMRLYLVLSRTEKREILSFPHLACSSVKIYRNDETKGQGAI